MSDVHLLDTCVISIAVCPSDERYEAVQSHLAAAQSLVIPALAVAEIRFGFAVETAPLSRNAERERQDLIKFLADFPHVAFDGDSADPYALIKAELCLTNGGPDVTLHEMGVGEIDLMIAAIAVQYGFLLATTDRNAGMRKIEKAAFQLERSGKDVKLRPDDWTIGL
jgi:predicted nucleic acid-binding protein